MKQFFQTVAPYLLVFPVFIASTSFAKKEPILSPKEIQKFLPEALRVRENGEANIFKFHLVEQTAARFSKNGQYFIVAYRINRGVEEEVCRLVTVKKEGNTVSSAPAPILNSYSSLSGCRSLHAVDLDQDGIDEIIVERVNGRATLSPVIFSWNGQRLMDVSPQRKKYPETGELSSVSTLSGPVRGKLVIIDSDRENFPDSKLKEYTYGNNKFSLVGEYDAVFYIVKTAIDKGVSVKPELSERSYTLSVANVSNHSRAVRAQVLVDGSIVLKSQDFCEKEQPKKSDKAAWSGNDDADDLDEDHCKRCTPKSDAYAIVNLKPTSEIEINVYGRKDSEVKLTINRKD